MTASFDYNDDRQAGMVYFDGKKIYLRPATFEQPTKEITLGLFNDYGAQPILLYPAKGDPIPAKLADGFPKENAEAFIYEFDPKPLQIEQGPLGAIDPSKAKNNFMKLNNKVVSIRELAMTLAVSRMLINKSLTRH